MAEVLRPADGGSPAAGRSPVAAGAAAAATHTLERHAIGLPAVTAQSAALIGPAVGAVATVTFVAGYSGGATPLAFLIGFLVCLCVAVVIGEYAKRLPSAGAFYTYLARTFGAKVGFVTGILLFGAYLLLFPFQLDFFGNFVSSLFPGSNVPWWIFAVAIIAFSTTLGVLGIKPSLRTGLIGLSFEVTVLTVFSIVIMARGGAHGNTLSVFNPSSSLKGTSGIFTAIVYTIFAFVGFESATALGDEARDRRRTIPKAVLLTTLVIGAFYVLVSYAVTIGFGNSTSGIKAMVSASAPFTTLADHFGNGVLSVFVNLAVISSFLALDIVTMIAVSRILWKMGSDRLMPHALSRVNHRQSPYVACLAAGALALVASLIGGGLWGALNFASWLSYFATLFFIGAYILISVGLTIFILREHREQFSWFRHAVLPFVSLAAMIWVLYGNVHPYPPSPLRWFIYATIGAIIVSYAVAWRLERRSPELMERAGQVLGEADVEEAAVPGPAAAPQLAEN